jgi:hypothetical protein
MNRQNDISEELKAIGSPILAALSSEMPYQVPNNYFQELPIYITDCIKAENESYIQLPASSVTPFSVPEHYFDSLADNILATIKSQKEQTTSKKTVPFTSSVQWNNIRWAAAAILLIMLGITASIRYSLSTSSVDNQLSMISGAALKEYALLHTDELDFSTSDKTAPVNGTTDTHTLQLNEDDVILYLNEYPLSPSETNL